MAPADTPSTVPGQRRRRRAGPPGDAADDPAAASTSPRSRSEARGVLPAAVADYYAGGAEAEITLARRPPPGGPGGCGRGCCAGSRRSRWRTSLLGSEVAHADRRRPLGLPGDGPSRTASGARPGRGRRGALMTVSTSASTPLADVAAAEPDAPKWFQLYRLHSPAHTDDLARRAGQAGYRALVLTVDLPVLGRRLRDVAQPTSRCPPTCRWATTRRPAPPQPTPPRPGPSTTSAGSASCPACRSWSRACSAGTTPRGACRPARRRSGCRRTAAGRPTRWSPARPPCPRSPTPSATRSRSTPTAASARARTSLTALALGRDGGLRGPPGDLGAGRPAGPTACRGCSPGSRRQLAHTMTLCGLSDVRAVPRDTVDARPVSRSADR